MEGHWSQGEKKNILTKVGSEVENFANPKESLEVATAIPMGGIDFAMDVAGNIPLLAPIDDAWDEKTKFFILLLVRSDLFLVLFSRLWLVVVL